MVYTLADLDAMYADDDPGELPEMDGEENLDDVLQPSGSILQDDLFDFGEIREEDMHNFQCSFLDDLDEDMDDPDSASSGHLVIDQKPHDNEPDLELDPDSE